jgi:hypothetical protein
MLEPHRARSTASAACALAVLAFAPRVRADPAASGLDLGARVGVSHPVGMLGNGSLATTPSLSDVGETAVPFGVEAGARLIPRLHLGGSLVFAPAFGNDSAYCASCSFRFDLQATAVLRFYLSPADAVSPWISYGAGWEVFYASFFDGTHATYQGPVFADVEVGVDLRKEGIAVGPYVAGSAGAFVARSLDPSPSGEPGPSVSVHGWFTVGIQGTYSR